MDGMLQQSSHSQAPADGRVRTRVFALGVAGGVAATIVIDLVTVAVLPLMGLPADGGFSVIGDTAAGFLALFGIGAAGGVALGAVLHYLIGAVLGGIFGLAVVRFPALRLSSIRKGVGLGILYTEIISLPILVLPPIILNWTTPEALWWFGFSAVMHAIWGAVLGTVMSFGLRSELLR
jgi:hypothetical protein